MAWVRFDDDYPTNPKMRSLGKNIPAKWLATVAVFFCARHLTDGLIRLEDDIDFLVAKSALPKATIRRCVPELVRVGLWDDMGHDMYLVHDYLDYNPSAVEVKEKREEAKERMRRLRAGSQDVRANKERTSREVRGPRARPVPQDQVLYPLPVEKVVDNSLRSSA